MHRYFLFFEIGFVAIMGYYYGWVAAGISLAFVVLSAISNLSREEEKKVEEVKRRYEFERKTMESCQKIYKDILTEIPSCANLIASYYWDKDRKKDNFIVEHARKMQENE